MCGGRGGGVEKKGQVSHNNIAACFLWTIGANYGVQSCETRGMEEWYELQFCHIVRSTTFSLEIVSIFVGY